ncbi:hypothetical protein C8A05DRAFT_16806 [Staphylotrichum tortipilum]|uniref:Uncharacterized protein n=1 Tax=Staphylotrichum tortipilum TaxID=2831512 RepID=A0AAN6MHH5_9PEZI|nr:hypothetical protein C8A05DRAFT_16806 [Staphylotrichum longicolle]
MAFTSRDRVVLGPLTTVFIPPAPCSIAVGLCTTCDVAWWGQTCALMTVQDDPGCWPPTTDGVPEPTPPLLGWGFYSPGLECPAGYTSACTEIAGQSAAGGWKAQYQMLPGETFVGCCPPGFRCDNLSGQTCLMRAKSTTLPTVSCETGASNNFGFTTLPNGRVNTLNLYAPMIQLAFQSSDRTALTTTSSSTSTANTSSSTTTTTSTTTASLTPSTTPPPSTSLTPGAIAGIAVSASAVLILLILAAAMLIWRRRQRDRPATANPPPTYNSESQGPKNLTHYYAGDTAELGPGHGRAEVPGEGVGRVEMAGREGGAGSVVWGVLGGAAMVAVLPDCRGGGGGGWEGGGRGGGGGGGVGGDAGGDLWVVTR